MTPFVAPPDYRRWSDVARLIHRSFDYMTPLLGHPATAMAVTDQDLRKAASQGTAHIIEADGQPVACAFSRPSRDWPDALYVGWLAVAASQRGSGLAGKLLTAAEDAAKAQGFHALTLDTGRALTDLHRFFRQAGFSDLRGTGTVISFRKAVG